MICVEISANATAVPRGDSSLALLRRHAALAAGLVLASLFAQETAASPLARPREQRSAAPWSGELRAHIEALRRGRDGDVAVFAHDLRRDLTFGYQADRPMYLASGIKLLFLVVLYAARERGQLRFDEELRYGREDVRDGAPSMNRQKLGQRYRIDELMLYMTRDSDNAATDLLLKRIGVESVERMLARERLEGFGPIVNMMDVRREVYGRLDPRAAELSAVDVRDVRWRDGYHPRLDLLQRHIGPPYGDYDEEDLEVAYDEYYALGRNHGSMRGVGQVLARLVEGRLVSPDASREILGRLDDVWTSGHRTRGAIPDELRVAHKTGTQRRRISDLAVVWLHDGTPLVLCIAVQDLPREEAEALLQSVAAKAFELASAHASS